jgi:predicted ATPase
MSRIKIKNFGPIKDGYHNMESDDFMEINKVTVFIGNQGSGKSTVAKLISTFTWMEKALTRGDYDKDFFIKQFAHKDQSKNSRLTYFRLENYLQKEKSKTSLIDYVGDSFHFRLMNGALTIEKESNEKYFLPQIMYVPAERNFIGYVKNSKALNMTSDSLIEFVMEYNNAKEKIKGILPLPINDVAIEYNKLNDIVYLKGDDYKIKLSEASSGFQSSIPLYLVSWYLSHLIEEQFTNSDIFLSSGQRERFRKKVQDINNNPNYTEEVKRILISEEASKIIKASFINIVEEPEQNLFPNSQRRILNSLLEFNNMSPTNKLILTTHSPYLLVYLTLCIEANNLKEKIKTKELEERLNTIVPLQSTINGSDVVVYQLDEVNGTIEKLKDYKGLPSDENKLNFGLLDANDDFSKLLDLEDLCQ